MEHQRERFWRCSTCGKRACLSRYLSLIVSDCFVFLAFKTLYNRLSALNGKLRLFVRLVTDGVLVLFWLEKELFAVVGFAVCWLFAMVNWYGQNLFFFSFCCLRFVLGDLLLLKTDLSSLFLGFFQKKKKSDSLPWTTGKRHSVVVIAS